jgi:hypothetical protein
VEKTKKRRLERKWKKSGKQSDLDAYKEQRNKYNTMLNNLRSKHLSEKISKNRGNSRDMFRSLNSALHRKVSPPLPQHDNATILANEFSDFFDDKISKIRTKLDNDNPTFPNIPKAFSGSPLSSFRQMSKDEIKKILNNMSKSCKLDPLPLWLVKECIDEFLPFITNIINLSLTQGYVPDKLKHATIRPLQKKMGLELTKSNYRPVSNLPFLSKALEAAVILQLEEHINSNELSDTKQSAYKKNHSTETLLVRFKNDIMTSLDEGEVVMLVLLDLSAAFDTIDHKILLKRLQNTYGIESTALRWFEAYLKNRTQSVAINGEESSAKTLKYGVPQGSKLGPILFNTYIAPLSKVAEKHNVIDHKYADDEQLILSFKPKPQTNSEQAFRKMENCIKDVRKFLHQNKLSNNSEKTEFMLIGSKHNLNKVDTDSLKVNDISIKTADKVRNLGVILDKTMSMEPQVKNMCKKAFFNIRNIASIRKCLSIADTKTAVHALVTPHLDYGNSLLPGTNKSILDKLQIAQNASAQLIMRLKKHDRISHVRKELHWLPVKARIEFKILNMTWKALNDQAPQYIMSMLRRSSNNRSLGSNNQNLLEVPRSKTAHRDKALSTIAPKLWNTLPLALRNTEDNNTFRRMLKKHLFHNNYQNP